MNAAHLHLVFNHFPLVGFVFSMLLLALGLYRANESYVRAGLLVILVSGLLAVPTYLLGDPAEDVIEKLPGFTKSLVHDHEEAAEVAIWFIAITTFISGASLWQSLKKNSTSKMLVQTIFLLNLISLVLIGRTNMLGGKISHPELRDGTSQPVITHSDHD